MVPGRETYDDWIGDSGLSAVGTESFFPHMSDEWESVVDQKLEQMKSDGDDATTNSPPVTCLQEWDVCCVDGAQQLHFVVSGEQPSQ